MTGVYRTVAGRIRRDLRDTEEIGDRVQKIWRRYKDASDEYYVDAAALNLHDVYAGLERLFEHIARQVDDSVPNGPHGHQDLLDQMASDIPSMRPQVLSDDTRQHLGRYRGFRHVVRNVYTTDFDATRIDTLVQRLPEALAAATGDLRAFADELERIADEGAYAPVRCRSRALLRGARALRGAPLCTAGGIRSARDGDWG
jgi:hypothetical protein